MSSVTSHTVTPRKLLNFCYPRVKSARKLIVGGFVQCLFTALEYLTLVLLLWLFVFYDPWPVWLHSLTRLPRTLAVFSFCDTTSPVTPSLLSSFIRLQSWLLWPFVFCTPLFSVTPRLLWPLILRREDFCDSSLIRCKDFCDVLCLVFCGLSLSVIFCLLQPSVFRDFPSSVMISGPRSVTPILFRSWLGL